MSNLDIDVTEVKQLVELVEKYHLEELTVEHSDISITVKGKSAVIGQGVVLHHAPGAHLPETAPSIEHEIEEPEVSEPGTQLEGNIVDIVAPLVGVFYRSPAPDAPHFVEIGDVIEVGSEVGLIEAMKVFSPIPSEVAGEVVDISAQNGKLVQQGEVLVRVRVPEE